jgi:segregation and condensation protein A
MDVIDDQFKVHLDEFTGPLDLLLHLVRSHEMEVRTLPLAQITAEYVEMLQFMKKIDLEVASEFLEIAAALVRFKARALLPSRSLAGDDDLTAEEEALLEQLVEHQVTRMAAQHLRGRERRAAAVWFRGEKSPGGVESEEVEIVEADLFSLVGAFKELLAGLDTPSLFAVDRDDYPVAEQVELIRTRLLALGEPIEFRDLFERNAPRGKLIATFLALLELIRSAEVRAIQESTFGKILVFPSASLAEEGAPA